MDSSIICPSRVPIIDSTYFSLLDSLYASLRNQQGFEGFLSQLTHCFNSSSASLLAIGKKSRQMRWHCTVGVSSHFIRWYKDNYSATADVDIHKFELLAATAEGFIAAGLELNNIELIDTVTDSLKPWIQEESIVDTAGLIIHSSENECLMLVLQRHASAGKFNAEDIAGLNRLASHIRQAAQLFEKQYEQQQAGDTLRKVMDSLTQATLVLNTSLEVQHINPAAEAVLRLSPSIAIVDEKLVIDEPEPYAGFINAMAKLASGVDDNQQKQAVSLCIPQGEQTISMTLTPLSNPDSEMPCIVMLQIYHPEQHALPQADQIQKVFKLTCTEAILCQFLVERCTLKDIARKRDVSIHTVREQIRKIYIKTGYRRQPELVAGILRTIG